MSSSSVFKIVFALLLFANGVLLFQNNALRSELKKFLPDDIKEGNVIAFSAVDLQGTVVSSVSPNSGSRKRVLFYLNPACGYCKKQMAYWIDLVLKTNDEPYEFIAITTEDNIQTVQRYLDFYGVEDWNVWIIKPEDARNAKLSATPITVILGSNGEAEKVWVGMWHSKEILEVEKYFGIDLVLVNANGTNTSQNNFNANLDKHQVNLGNFNVSGGGNYNANKSNSDSNFNVK